MTSLKTTPCFIPWVDGPYTLHEWQIQALLLPTSTNLTNTVTKALSWLESSCLEGLVKHKHLVLQGNMQMFLRGHENGEKLPL